MFPSRSGVTLKQPGGWAVLNLKGDFFFIIILFYFSCFLSCCRGVGQVLIPIPHLACVCTCLKHSGVTRTAGLMPV